MQNHREMLNQGAIDNHSNYCGEIVEDNFVGLCGQSRDSSCLERSNFETILAFLGGESENVVIHRFGHWACGWIEEMFINSNDKDLLLKAEKIREDLEDYPVFDEQHFCELEQSEAENIWETCYNDSERLRYMRDHSSQFEGDFIDLLNNARGKWFSGYASELLD